jgi:diguanylate cyclase (GGDEF)-like protein
MFKVTFARSQADGHAGLSSRLLQAATHHQVPDAVEAAASFGRWWFDPDTSELMLSAAAARQLNVLAGQHVQLADGLTHVVTDDRQRLISLLSSPARQPVNLEFRIINAVNSLRWLRLSALPADLAHPQILSGILMDITDSKHTAMRERLGFELTEFLIGANTFDDAIVSVIQLICKNLNWQWGAYWALGTSADGKPQLACKNFWHSPEQNLAPFSQESTSIFMTPGKDLVGKVWESGEACWVESIGNDPRLLRSSSSAQACQLSAGYIFTVTYMSEDGHQHKPGVLEFFSSFSRQPDALLPSLSNTIGALIAQVSQRHEQQAMILHLAEVDELTGLFNRNHFYSRLTQACEAATQASATFGLIFIDLDRFKPINDAFGHEAGNVVLHEFARRLRALAPAGSRLGRLGGDEFALLVSHTTATQLLALAEEVLLAARTPFTYKGVELTVSASIGISQFPDNGNTCPELLRSADAAMYSIKKSGRNGCDFFSLSSPDVLGQQQSALAQRLAIETDLHHALQGPELFLVYQPIFDVTTGQMNAVEALIRWRRADGTFIPPDVFIPIAEQSHLIVQIGKWVAAQACRDLVTLRNAQFTDLKVHINMAASEFMNNTLPQELLVLVTSFDLAPHQLSLELTEGMLMKCPEQVVPVMHTLRQHGFEISLDDFGMGHSSLSLLKNLPISSMKIDRSFVQDLLHHKHDRAIVQTIIDLGHHMGLDVIAEGVETQEQLTILQQSGCRLIQGYLLCRPKALAELLDKYPAGRWQPAA